MTGSSGPGSWIRPLLALAIQLPALALIVVVPGLEARICATLWAVTVCCAATDSARPAMNACLLGLGVLWLVVPFLI